MASALTANGNTTSTDSGEPAACVNGYQQDINANTKFCWTADLSADPPTFSGAMIVSGLQTGWVGWGVNPERQMVGTDAVIGLVNGNIVQQYQLLYQTKSGVQPRQVQTLTDTSISTAGAETIMTFTRPTAATDSYGQSLNDSSSNNLWMVWAHGATSTVQQHATTRRGTLQVALQLQKGKRLGVAMVDNSSAVDYRAAYAHGICMAVAFGFIVPLAIAMARYGRGIGTARGSTSTTTGGGGGMPIWLKLHMGLQLTAFTLAMVALGLIVHWVSNDWQGDHFDNAHSKTGISLLALIFVQILGGLGRPHAPMPTSAKKSHLRRSWEIAHRLLAVGIFGFAIYQVLNGIDILPADIDERKWSLVFMGLLLFMVLLFSILEVYMRWSGLSVTSPPVTAVSGGKDDDDDDDGDNKHVDGVHGVEEGEVTSEQRYTGVAAKPPSYSGGGKEKADDGEDRAPPA